jgi:hypothetical protein
MAGRASVSEMFRGGIPIQLYMIYFLYNLCYTATRLTASRSHVGASPGHGSSAHSRVWSA